MKVNAVIVSRLEADKMIKYLRKNGYIDERIKTEKHGNYIAIAVRKIPEDKNITVREYDFLNSYEVNIKERMHREAEKKGIDPDEIPDKWVMYGRSMVVKKPVSRKVFDILKDLLHIESIYYYDYIRGEYRQPVVIHQYGRRGEVSHRENGLIYAFDPEKIMFSPGNTNERTAMR
ncbi:MAG: class I SAM-dependent methyltransferase, partial [Thermoplasmata archaeon]